MWSKGGKEGGRESQSAKGRWRVGKRWRDITELIYESYRVLYLQEWLTGWRPREVTS